MKDRQALYELVWSKPMVQAAKDIGLSDRGLAQRCKSLAIPLPPRGFWALNGERPPAPPLPDVPLLRDSLKVNSGMHHAGLEMAGAGQAIRRLALVGCIASLQRIVESGGEFDECLLDRIAVAVDEANKHQLAWRDL